MLANYNSKKKDTSKPADSRITRFFKENIYLILAFIICSFLVFYNLGKIEFWGEDEGQTLLYASRFIMGMLTDSHTNLTAFYTNTTLSAVILIQVPFIMLLGAREIAARMPSAIVTVLTLFVIYKIGRLYFNKRSTNILVLLFAVSGATGLFKSAIGVSFYIFFILLAFYKIEKYLFSPVIDERNRLPDMVQSLLFLTLALIFVPDAYFYVPYFAVLLLINVRRIGIKRILLSLIAPVIIFSGFYYFQFLYPKKILGFNSGTYDHLLGRKSGIVFSFNIKELILGYVTSYSIYFVILFAIAVFILIYLRIKRVTFFPKFIGRTILLFSLHSIFWLILVKNECGHLMNSYPVFMFIIAFSFGTLLHYLSENRKKAGIDQKNMNSENNDQLFVTGHSKRILRVIITGFIVLFLLLNFYHTFILFNDLSLNKDKYPLFYKPFKIPCGYVEGHKVGIKSAAFLLRDLKEPGQLLVSDKGVAFNFVYMGGGFTSYAAKFAIDSLKDGRDILAENNIRFVGIESDYKEQIYIDTIEKMGFDKIIIENNGKEIYYIYDIANHNNKVTIIDRDEYDRAYNSEYINIFKAFPDYVGQ